MFVKKNFFESQAKNSKIIYIIMESNKTFMFVCLCKNDDDDEGKTKQVIIKEIRGLVIARVPPEIARGIRINSVLLAMASILFIVAEPFSPDSPRNACVLNLEDLWPANFFHSQPTHINTNFQKKK